MAPMRWDGVLQSPSRACFQWPKSSVSSLKGSTAYPSLHGLGTNVPPHGEHSRPKLQHGPRLPKAGQLKRSEVCSQIRLALLSLSWYASFTNKIYILSLGGDEGGEVFVNLCVDSRQIGRRQRDLHILIVFSLSFLHISGEILLISFNTFVQTHWMHNTEGTQM